VYVALFGSRLNEGMCNWLCDVLNRLQGNNLTIAIADKGKTTVIIDKNNLKQKIDTFIQGIHITGLNKDPTDSYQKQIQQSIQNCDVNMGKCTNK